MHPAIAVLTRKSAAGIIAKEGSEAWVLSADKAQRYRYLVCCRNGKHAEADADEPHASAFLVALIEEFRPLAKNSRGQQRYRICFRTYARVLCSGTWKSWRNPVRYTSLEELGIRLDNLAFSTVEDLFDLSPPPQPIRKLTIAEAKEGLAAMFDISPDAIEITIKA
jgi:hypothetical protein